MFENTSVLGMKMVNFTTYFDVRKHNSYTIM